MIYESVTQIVIFLLRLFDLNDLYMSEAKITEKSEKMNRILCWLSCDHSDLFQEPTSGLTVTPCFKII